jgi:hypothetical protein
LDRRLGEPQIHSGLYGEEKNLSLLPEIEARKDGKETRDEEGKEIKIRERRDRERKKLSPNKSDDYVNKPKTNKQTLHPVPEFYTKDTNVSHDGWPF